VLERVRLRGDETVLDAGCGTGRLTEELLQLLPNGRVIGVDLSDNMIETAERQLRPRFRNQVGFVVADLQQLPFEAAFDGVFSTAAFHWVPDHELLVRSLYRALRPSGWIEAQCGGGPNIARFRNRVAAVSASPRFSAFLASYCDSWVFSDAETGADRLRRAGFINVKTWIEPAPTRFENKERFCEFAAMAILHRRLALIPEESLRQQFLAELANQAAADDPPFELDYWRLNLSARKPE
jgi:trans-aconitate 2-methyltransferase